MRVSTEYPELTRRFFAHGIAAEVRLSYGASEAKVPDIADCIVDLTETGRALRAAGLWMIDTILTALHRGDRQPASVRGPGEAPRHGPAPDAAEGHARGPHQVLVKLNVSVDDFAAVIAILPSAKSPTVSHLAGGGGFAIETVVEKSAINILIPALKDAGATDILELPLTKIVH